MCFRKSLALFGYFLLFSLNSEFVNGEPNESAINSSTDVVVPLSDRTFFKKCSEYQKSCASVVSPFIIDGEDAAAKEFPHMALIGDLDDEHPNEYNWFCSGVLISENFVITAAHCTKSSRQSAKYVRLGDLDHKREDDDARVSQYNITETFVHPNYTTKWVYNDIALLRIDNKVDFNPYIQPACLPDPNTVLSEKVVATGWGVTTSEFIIKSKLQKVQLNLVSFDDCRETFQSNRRLPLGIDNRTQLCAGSKDSERDACQGFAGGPLLNTDHKFSCLYEIVGITSFGSSCGLGNPSGFTRITPYIDWIESIVWRE